MSDRRLASALAQGLMVDGAQIAADRAEEPVQHVVRAADLIDPADVVLPEEIL